MRISLEDHGQDFLWFDLKLIGRGKRAHYLITDTGPFQAWIWNGKRLKPASVRRGSRPTFTNGDRLLYAIAKIRSVRTKAEAA